MNLENPFRRYPSKRRPERLYEVAFDLPDDVADWACASSERLWSEKTDVPLQAQIRSIPFYVRGISFGDTVIVRVDHTRRELVFDHVVARSGHSTVRVILRVADAEGRVAELLHQFDCPWETNATGLLWAIDVPPAVNYLALTNALIALREEGAIGVQEGSVAKNHHDLLCACPE